MTSIIDVLFNHDVQFRKTCQQNIINKKNQSQKQNYQSSLLNSHLNNFLLTDVNKKYDILFQTKATQLQVTIQVFLLSKLGEILKTSSEISRIELIQKCFNDQEFYRPCVNPITGFFYLKLSFVNVQKQSLDSTGQSQVRQIIKKIDIEKLLSSLQKIQGIEQSIQSDEFEGWRTQEQRNRLSCTKAISKTLREPNFQMTLSYHKQKMFNLQYNNTRLKNKYYQKILESSNQREISIDLSKISQSLKEVQRVHPHLSTFIKKKSRRINFDPLFIDTQTKTKLEEQMKEMCLNNINTSNFKVNEEVFGNINLKLQRLTLNAFNKMTQFFGSLSKSYEYENIDKYFDPKINLPIKISLEAKGQSLLRYLEKNCNSISLETKMRILVQIYTFVNVLWEENELIFMIDDLNQVLITRRLGIKIKSFESFFKSYRQMIWEDSQLLNEKRSESILNLSNIFFKLFYRQRILYKRPKISVCQSTQLMNECKLKGISRLNVYKYLPKEVKGKTKQLLSSLNYIFAEQVYMASKMIGNRTRKGAAETNKKNINLFKGQIFQIETDFNDEGIEHESQLTSKNLNTKLIACWLMKNL